MRGNRWVGNAGKHATHAVCAANLVVNQVSHGVHFFLVPLRDPRTMLPLPGVLVGDIGPKSGPWNQIDNGFMVFDNYVLSIDAMLDRYQTIDTTSTGKYVTKIDPTARFGRTLGLSFENQFQFSAVFCYLLLNRCAQCWSCEHCSTCVWDYERRHGGLYSV